MKCKIIRREGKTIVPASALELGGISDAENLADYAPSSYAGFGTITSPIMMLFCIILMAYAVIKIFFANLKRGIYPLLTSGRAKKNGIQTL